MTEEDLFIYYILFLIFQLKIFVKMPLTKAQKGNNKHIRQNSKVFCPKNHHIKTFN